MLAGKGIPEPRSAAKAGGLRHHPVMSSVACSASLVSTSFSWSLTVQYSSHCQSPGLCGTLQLHNSLLSQEGGTKDSRLREGRGAMQRPCSVHQFQSCQGWGKEGEGPRKARV